MEKKRVHVCTICDADPRKRKLRNAVRFTYDLQKLRIATLQRSDESGAEESPADLDEKDKAFIKHQSEGLEALEKSAFREINRYASAFKVYEWLMEHKGIGPAGAGVLLSEFDIHLAPRPSNFWSFAGLAVGDDGRADHPVKGERLSYNSWLRSKLIVVIGGGLMKADNETYRGIFDQYMHRKRTQAGPCMLCLGTGKASQPKKDADGRVSEEKGKPKPCWNCVANTEDAVALQAWKDAVEDYLKNPLKKSGRPRPDPREAGPPPLRFGYELTPQRAPWGRGAAHRKEAAVRYMVKQFVADFWRAWRLAEGLPVVPTYHEAIQGHVHGA